MQRVTFLNFRIVIKGKNLGESDSLRESGPLQVLHKINLFMNYTKSYFQG